MRVVIAELPLILALILAAPGDLFRCVSEDGSVHFQDQRCAGEQLGAIRSNSTRSERRLRDWLNELPPTPTPGRTAPARIGAAASPRAPGPIALPTRPADQYSLAQCSEQFLQCAGSDDLLMDRCVAGIPQCPGRRSSHCCAPNFIDRYRALRHLGVDRKTAVRDALRLR